MVAPWPPPEDAGAHSRLWGPVLLVTRLVGGRLVLGVNGDVGRPGFVVIGFVKLLRDVQEVLIGDGIAAAGETLCKERQGAGESRQRLARAPNAASPHGWPDPGDTGRAGHSAQQVQGCQGGRGGPKVPTHTNPMPWGQEPASGLQAWEPSIKHWVSWEASVVVSPA